MLTTQESQKWSQKPPKTLRECFPVSISDIEDSDIMELSLLPGQTRTP